MVLTRRFQIPYALDWFSAHVLKNLVFVWAFMLLFANDYAEKRAERKSRRDAAYAQNIVSTCDD